MTTHLGVVDTAAGTAAAVSVLSAVHEFSFHEWVGTLSGVMAITFYLYRFAVWIYSNWRR